MSSLAAAIVPAAGTGSRMGLAVPKQFHELAGLPILIHTLRRLELVEELGGIVVVAPAAHRAEVEELISRYRLTRIIGVVAGGRLRQDSVKAGLDSLPASTVIVLVHDGARPLVPVALIRACLREAAKTGAAMAAIPVKDTLKAVAEDGLISNTVDRQHLWQAQTPQAMRTDLLKKAFAAAAQDGFVGTDEAALLEHINAPVTVVPGSERNIKITRPEDLELAEALLMHERMHCQPLAGLRVGHGYDVHALVAERPLVLGGVTIPHRLGLAGHSDADVLTHALCDAILGAVGGGDIGRHFPDSDDAYKGICSLRLLEQVVTLAEQRGYMLVNADITVVAQRPRLADFLPQIIVSLATACRISPAAINCKATTTEKLGFAGREEGIAVHAVVLMGSK